MVLRCVACGHTVSGPARSDEQRAVRGRGGSSKHRPVDDGPPSNPVIDPEVAARLLEQLDS